MTRLEYERRIRNLSRASLAKAAGVPVETISAVEAGVGYVPAEDALEALARFFSIWPGRVFLKTVSPRVDPEEVADAAPGGRQ